MTPSEQEWLRLLLLNDLMQLLRGAQPDVCLSLVPEFGETLARWAYGAAIKNGVKDASLDH
jgi:hypothetical protein